MLERSLSPRLKENIATTIYYLRKQPLIDKHAQKLYEQWVERASLIPSAIKDEIGKLWLTEILGVDNCTVNKFIEGDSETWKKIGLLHAGGGDRKENVKTFWRGVGKLVPGFISKGDIKYLKKVDKGAWGAWKMICVLETTGWYDPETASNVIKTISNNAHCFK